MRCETDDGGGQHVTGVYDQCRYQDTAARGLQDPSNGGRKSRNRSREHLAVSGACALLALLDALLDRREPVRTLQSALVTDRVTIRQRARVRERERETKDALLADGSILRLQLGRLLQILDRLLLLPDHDARHGPAVQRLCLLSLAEPLAHGLLLRVSVDSQRARRGLDALGGGGRTAKLEGREGDVEEEGEAQGRELGLEGEVPLGEVEVPVEVCGIRARGGFSLVRRVTRVRNKSETERERE